MRRNIHDLNEVIKLGTRLGAVEFSVSNVLAHNTELLDENLYLRSMNVAPSAQISPLIHMPLMDINEKTVPRPGRRAERHEPPRTFWRQ